MYYNVMEKKKNLNKIILERVLREQPRPPVPTWYTTLATGTVFYNRRNSYRITSLVHNTCMQYSSSGLQTSSPILVSKFSNIFSPSSEETKQQCSFINIRRFFYDNRLTFQQKYVDSKSPL